MSLRVVLINYAHGTGAGRPEELLDALPALTGWAEALHRAGARVTVLQIFELEASLRRAGVDYLLVPDGPVAGLRLPRRLHRRAALLCPDVVHLNGLLFAPQILDLRWRLPPATALVVQHHAETPRRGAAGWLEGLALSRVDGFLFAGRDVAASWRVHIGPQQPVFEVMEGSSPFTPGDRRAARRRTGMRGAPVVFWAGHLDANKDPLTVLAGFERALETLPAARLYMTFLGRDLLAAVESRRRHSAALGRAVTLLGRLDHGDMEDCFQSADVFVQGSHREGSGFALAEAMACGVVPVVTDIPSFRFMTAAESDDEAVGALWPPGDADAFAAALGRVAAGDLERQGRAARRLFDGRLSWPAIGRRTLAAYAEVHQRRRQRASAKPRPLSPATDPEPGSDPSGDKPSRAERGPGPASAPVSPAELAGVVLGALVAFALAFLSPADDTSADPGLALLVSQRMLEGGSAWLGDPALADDYRVQSGVYYGWGVPVLSMPAVWTARRLGYDMRRPADERALQNLISALCCGALFVLLHLLARSRAGPRAAAVIAVVCVFGSPLMSTLATGLWNSAYATVLLAAVLLFWVRRPGGSLLLPAAMIGLAGLCRPTAGFFALGAGAFLLARGRRRLAAAAVVAVVAAAAAVWLIGWDEVLFYYSPRRLLSPRAEPLEAAVGLLLSPGRGLLVYCPFVAVVVVALAARRQALCQPLVVLALVWLGSQLVGTALRPRWWAGHSFGPRYFAEVLPGVALVAAIAWRGLDSASARRRWGAAFVATGLTALALHSGIALFNPWAARWNSEPDIDRHPELLWSFAYPPFLSTASRHEARLVSFQRRTRRAYRLGEWINAESDLAAFGGFSAPEAADGHARRWTRRRRASIFLDLPSGAAGLTLCALELRAGARGAQSVTVRLGEVTIGDLRFRGWAPQRRLLGFDCALLDRSEDEVEIVFELPDARPAPGDPRLLGLAFDALRLESLAADGEVTWAEDIFFGDGFSNTESPDGLNGWRWTDGAGARLWLPVSGRFDAVELEGWSHGRQAVGLSWDGVPLGVREIGAGDGRQAWRWPVAAGLPQPAEPRLVELHLELSDPRPAPGDGRRLGFALVRARALGTSP